MEIKQIRERLRRSLEMQVMWRNLIIVAVTTAVLLVIFAIGDEFDGFFWALAGFTTAVLIAPIAVFTAIRTYRIFRKPEAYIFCRTTPSQPHAGALRSTMYFTVLLEDPDDGSKFFVDTHSIFYSHGIVQPLMEDYINNPLTIAYNRETEMVVVIR
ncbi:MAG: hypothetical protein IJZ39_06670 [Oscillospiraceae bacterium]|nr:hypothetical protein [Oscillospiraceae bacterium]